MALSLLCRQSHRLKHIKTLISIQITEKQFQQPRTIFINRSINSTIIDLKQIRSFSITQPLYSDENNHAAYWKFEKYLSAALLGIYPAAFLVPSLFWEYLLIIGTVVHFHLGFEGIIADYVSSITFSKITHGLLLVFSLSVLVGLINFTRNDVGVVKAIQQLWSIKGFEEDPDEGRRSRKQDPCLACKPEEPKDKKNKYD